MVCVPPALSLEAGLTIPDDWFVLGETAFTNDTVVINVLTSTMLPAASTWRACCGRTCFRVTTWFRDATRRRMSNLGPVNWIVNRIRFGDACFVAAAHGSDSSNNSGSFVPCPKLG